MPQIIITTNGPGESPDETVEVHRERVSATDVETDTSSHLLVERIGWALSDAERLEDSAWDTDPGAQFSRRAGSIEDTAVH